MVFEVYAPIEFTWRDRDVILKYTAGRVIEIKVEYVYKSAVPRLR